jgi:DNA replication and repair protein RecF
MYLKNLALTGFRNYTKAEVSFHPSINVFLGENAQGKTNMMESIYVLAMARSHRTNNDKELIGWNQEFTKIAGQIEKKNTSFPLEIVLSKKGKKAKLNHLEQKKLSGYIGHLNVILFAPEDLSLVKGAPAVRRKFIDMEMGQMSAIYLHHLVEYQKVLKQRNQYLKQSKFNQRFDEVYLDILTEQLAAEGSEVLFERFRFTKKLEEWARGIHKEISQEKETLHIEYASSLKTEDKEDKEQIMQEFLQQYKKNQARELDQGTTLIGPHRDDIRFYVNKKNVQTYGSQGQQRTTALSVKLAEIELMHEMTGEYPVLLLDDVLSELDDDRQTHLLKAIQDKVQTFLTTTSLDGVKKELLNEPRIFRVKNGQIEQESE